jgi:phage tail sheath gpL-like
MAINNPTFPVASNVVTLRLVIQTNSNKHVNYLNAIQRDSVITLQRLASMFEAFANGSYLSNTDISTNSVNATGTITFSSLANNDTITINGTTFTAKTSGAAGAVQFNLGASDTAAAANAVTVINANESVNETVFAQSTGAVITLFCRVPGVIGNLCTIAISAHGSVSGANLASGADGTDSNVSHGL